MSTKDNKKLELKGLSEHNLKDLSLAIDHDQLTVITGLSGSGKSTLAFDTIYAEGQRRYIQTFNAYTRQFLEKFKKPDLKSAKNIRPAIAIQQKVKIHASRSTVGSISDLNDYLSILFANLSEAKDPESKKNLSIHKPEDIFQKISKYQNQDYTIYICAKITLQKNLDQQISVLQELGYNRYLLSEDSKIYKFSEDQEYSKGKNIYLLIERVKSKKLKEKRILQAATEAYQQGSNSLSLLFLKDDRLTKEEIYHNFYTDSDGNKLQVIEKSPRIFSNNNPVGACPDCKGFGYILRGDPEKIISNPNLSLDDQAIGPWSGKKHSRVRSKLKEYCQNKNISTETPWKNLPKDVQEELLYAKKRNFVGVVPWLEKLQKKAYKTHVRIFLTKYRSQFPCTSCNQTGLRAESQYFHIKDQNFSDLQKLEIKELFTFVKSVKINQRSAKDLYLVQVQILKRLELLIHLGLGYLQLNRQSRTLSGGETQRVNIVSALGSELTATQFVLDEPSVGLHPKDSEKLIAAVQDLKDQGNSVLMVEHDLDCIQAADQVLELGPLAGEQGGEIIYHGPGNKWQKPETLKYQPNTVNKEKLQIKSLKVRNLDIKKIELPLNNLVCFTGMSGSGKSTLAKEVLLKCWQEYQQGSKTSYSVKGFDKLSRVLLIDQTSLMKSPRAVAATYTGLWDIIRTGLADTEAARLKLYQKSHFSFNVDAGRCQHCKGAGYIKEDLQFLSDVLIPCEVCLGKRFQQGILEIEYLGKNVSEWLETTIQECQECFSEQTKIQAITNDLCALGLGHLRLGHPLSALSGGESQRLKLVPYLQKVKQEQALLIFDEPTTGLHTADTQRLIKIMQQLIQSGHSIICIEHNLEMINAADWVIDLGPEGGKDGGRLIFSGTVEELKKNKKSFTAKYLCQYSQQSKSKQLAKKQTTRKTKKRTEKADYLEIIGAKEHNLKNVSLKIPHDQLVAIVGVSGSGKSTLAKDIIYAEGQRRYLDCLSPYARHFIKELSRADVTSLHNLRPSVCVHQHTFQPSKLSTVGTFSEVYNYMRLLFSKIGTQYCLKHPEQPVSAITPEDLLPTIKKFGKERVKLLASIIKGKKGHHRSVIETALEQEIAELRVDGKFVKTSKVIEGLSRHQTHDLDFVWGEIVPDRIPEQILIESIQEIFALSSGNLIIHNKGKDHVYSNQRGCPVCNTGYFRPDPEDLSFNSQRGRCLSCSGTGIKTNKPCPSCGGSRIKPEGLAIKINDSNIFEVSSLSIKQAADFFQDLRLDDYQLKLAAEILEEINTRLARLLRLKLDYIPLNRNARDLSKGELQRLRIANAIGTDLSGVLYIFDEPSAGLHPVNHQHVLEELRSLQKAGNSVILIEHDQESIKKSDWVVELGPKGGRLGGEITFNDQQKKYKTSPLKTIEIPAEQSSKFLEIKTSSLHNIKDLELQIPLQSFVCLAGVSGAGKSTLLNEIILPTLRLNGQQKAQTSWKSELASIKSDIKIKRILEVDKSPIGKTSRSTPASFLKIWDEIRKLLAATTLARMHNWKTNFFSYNSDTPGRCEHCKGQGYQNLEMSFLANTKVLCPYCEGKRFSQEAQAVRYLDLNPAEILDLSFAEAKNIFTNHPKIYSKLKSACDLGLGYIKLGQNSATLSGGEAQRIKLTNEIAKLKNEHTLYILDEPSVGLSQQDNALLLKVLLELRAQGHSVIIIEHDQDFLQHADHIIELGPGAGAKGGKIVYQGVFENLINKKSPWGKVLAS